jgi:hypothetical protein
MMRASRAGGATIYVTLEPCNHFGRTPPCTRKILDAGIRRVVVAMADPNPAVTGGGSATLQDRGDRGNHRCSVKRRPEPSTKGLSRGSPPAGHSSSSSARRPSTGALPPAPAIPDGSPARPPVSSFIGSAMGSTASWWAWRPVKKDDPSLTTRLDGKPARIRRASSWTLICRCRRRQKCCTGVRCSHLGGLWTGCTD